jgi:hypothetical protein
MCLRSWWRGTGRSPTTAAAVQQVRGLGVVGHQPLLKPGEQFEYTSWAQIATPQGSMQGPLLRRDRRRALVRDPGARVRAGRHGRAALMGAAAARQPRARHARAAAWDLTALLNAADPKASRPERHVWLVRLFEWLRHGPTDAGRRRQDPARCCG